MFGESKGLRGAVIWGTAMGSHLLALLAPFLSLSSNWTKGNSGGKGFQVGEGGIKLRTMAVSHRQAVDNLLFQGIVGKAVLVRRVGWAFLVATAKGAIASGAGGGATCLFGLQVWWLGQMKQIEDKRRTKERDDKAQQPE